MSALIGTVLFTVNAALCAVNVAIFIDSGNPANAGLAVFVGLVAIHLSIVWRD